MTNEGEAVARRLANAIAPEAPEAERERFAGFLSRLFTMPPAGLAAVSTAIAGAREVFGRNTLRGVADAAGVTSKEGARLALARAVSRCPELRALLPRYRLRFKSPDARRLEAALAAGCVFTGRLERDEAGALVSPAFSRGTAVEAPRSARKGARA